jgi:hypothetical protein
MGAGDFNGDGQPDPVIVASDLVGFSRLRVFLSTPGFPVLAQEFSVSPNPSSLAVANLDAGLGDDLVVASQGNIEFESFLLDGSGVFQSHQVLPLQHPPAACSIGQFDMDCEIDLVICEPGANRLTLSKGMGGGFFAPAILAGSPADPRVMAAGKMNGDSTLDLVLGLWASSQVQIFLNDGTGAFAPGGARLLPSFPNQLRINDFDQDGRNDFAVIHGSALDIFCGDGCGGIVPGRGLTLTFSSLLRGMIFRDVNGDRFPDIILSEPQANILWVCLNTSN